MSYDIFSEWERQEDGRAAVLATGGFVEHLIFHVPGYVVPVRSPVLLDEYPPIAWRSLNSHTKITSREMEGSSAGYTDSSESRSRKELDGFIGTMITELESLADSSVLLATELSNRG